MKRPGCVISLLFLLVCLSMFGNLVLLGLLGAKGHSVVAAAQVVRERPFEEVLERGGKLAGAKVAVIPVTGIIAANESGSLGQCIVEDFRRAIEQARGDSTVKAVVVSMDSPGGELTASDVLYHQIKGLAAVKPVVVYFSSLGASGAYYAACGGTEIWCHETTFTGSIGVIISTLNYRKLFGKVGLEAVVFKSGEFKDMLNGARELTEAEREYVQGLVMQSYRRFLRIVSKARGLDENELRNGVADGRILTGEDALAARLVDKLGYVEEAYDRAAELAGAQGAQVVKYRKRMSFGDLFKFFGQMHSNSVKLDVGLPELELKPGRAYLLPAFFAP